MITDNSTIEELGVQLAIRRGSIRIAAKHRGTVFVCVVEVPGGSATITNVSLGVAIGAAFAFMRLHPVEPVEPVEHVEADPEGAKIGPAPRAGTRVGYPTPENPTENVHCAGCGFGETEGEHFDPAQACPSCGALGRVCTQPPQHPDNHDNCEGSQS
jgi:hypothetical protein